MTTFTGTAGNDTLPPIGGDNSGDDIMNGLAGTDTLLGGTGNDILDGGAGADTFQGGAGNDAVTYATSNAAVSINIAGSINHGGTAEGDVFLDTVEHLIGSGFGDTLTGDDAGTRFSGMAGDDAIRGLGGSDALDGGVGNDQLDGGDGNDTLTGGAGADAFVGGTGTDTVTYAASGAGINISLATNVNHGGDAEGDRFLDHVEIVIGSAFLDKMGGTADVDQFQGGDGNDYLYGGGGADVLSGEGNNDFLYGEDGNDSLSGGSGVDHISGGAGDDIMRGGTGSTDIFNGGAGTDTVAYDESTAAVSVNLATGITLGGAAYGDQFLDHIEAFIGSRFGDTFVGNDANDTFSGADGNDTLSGGVGVDTLNGGNGDDILSGGWGADFFTGGAGNDTVTYADNTVGMAVNLSNGTAAGGQAAGDRFLDHIEVIIGSAFNDTMTGSALADTFIGGDGNDTFRGGAGADIFTGGAGIDTVSYTDSTAGVTVDLGAGTGIGGTAAGDRFLDHIEAVVGSAFNDSLTASALADTFTGGAGADSLSYAGSTAGVTVDTMTGIGSGGWAAGDHYLDSFESILGSNFNDVLVGGDGTGTITGGAGDDVLSGGVGVTRFVGSDGFDTASYANSSTAVTINLDTGVNTGAVAVGDLYDRTIEAVSGSNFADTMISGSNAALHYTLLGGDGNDTITAGVAVSGSVGYNHFEGGNGDDVLTGNFRPDVLEGGSGNDTLVGGGGGGGGVGDALDGGDGDDTLTGDRGFSTVTGGSGADRFVLTALGNSADVDPAYLEVITDFSAAEGDKIDLSHVTSSVSFIGTGAFTGVAGQLRYEYDTVHDQTLLLLDRNGDGQTDYGETLTGHITPTAGDFLV